MATPTAVLSLRLDPKLKKRLDKLAKSTHRSRAFLAAEALEQYVELNEWQISEIKKGLEEADRGEFVSDEEMKRTFERLTSHEG